jgi:hypothetical protein
MRTKTLLLTAAVAVAGVASSMAQSNVYSVNVVGYVNIPLPANKYVLIENPLDKGNNSITNVIPGPSILPDSVFLYRFKNGAFLDAEQFIDGLGWFPGTNILAPGDGFFVISPSATNITFTGDVIQGAATNTLVAGYSLVGSQVPQSIPVGAAGITDPTNTMTMPVEDSMNIYLWDSTAQAYKDAIQYVDGLGWFDPNSVFGTNGPVPGIGEAFFVFKANAANWTRTFTVQ